MKLQAALLILLAITSSVCRGQQVAGLSIGDYLKQHPEYLLANEENDQQQQTLWDRSLYANRDLSYPVENQPVPLMKLHLERERKERRRPKSRGRERRQIAPESCYLLFANRVHVVQMQNVPSLRINVALTGFNNTVAVDFDKRDGFLFWSDVREHRIYRKHINDVDFTVLVETGIRTPDGIAWDWVNKKLYWTDDGDKDLEVYDPFTGCRKVLFQFESTSHPRAIVLDPDTRWMYWTDWGSSPKIERASMDGTHRTVLHSTDLVWPNALTIDYETQTLYWMDASLNRLESSRTNGSERRHYSNTQPFIHHPFSLVFFQGNLFWSDWQLKAILGTSVDSNFAQINVLLSDLTLDPMGLTAACAERQQDITNLCYGRCKDFCLLSSSEYRGYLCNCCNNASAEVTGLSDATCEQPCGENGRCTGHNYCTCDDNWRGPLCDKGMCAGGCVHGECVGPDTCLCDDGWEGESCNEAACCSEWTGPQCEPGPSPSPPSVCLVRGGCLNGGSCKGISCECRNGYGGKRCEKACAIQGC